jgi:hypothetical protein
MKLGAVWRDPGRAESDASNRQFVKNVSEWRTVASRAVCRFPGGWCTH